MSSKRNTIVLHKGLNPTSYYWLTPLDPYFIDLHNNFDLDLLYNSDTIIIVRYIPIKYLLHLFKLNSRNIKIILFLDDDLLSPNLFSSLPINYRLNLFFKIFCFKNILCYFIREIWVTNFKLKKKIGSQLNKKLKIKVLDLKFRYNFVEKKLHRISFIGTSSHVLELRWIKKLFFKIQSCRDDCLIELFINPEWRSYFKSIPKLKLTYLMDWETFLLDTQNRNVDIVLNPIFHSEFNSFRSPTKFFDTTRLGAVGIYSQTIPYNSFVKDNYDGILLKNDLDLWCQNIIELLENPNKREYLYQNAMRKLV